MIKLGKHIYIHILTVILFVFCYINRKCGIFFAAYGVMAIHECAHLLAALWIGLKPSYMAFYPFGVNLRLFNKIVYGLADEIILYAAGPCVNGLLAAVSLFWFGDYGWGRWFYYSNLLMFFMNLLPVAPLDGGIIFKKILCRRLGYYEGTRTARAVSAVLSLCFLGAGIYGVYITGYNFTVLFLSVLMIGNVFTQKEKYHWEFLKELMFYKKQANGSLKTEVFVVGEEDPKTTVKRFKCGKNNVVIKTDDDGKIKKIMTDREIIGNILDRI